MMSDRLCDTPAAISSSRPAATAKNVVVIGLDDDLIAIKGQLRGESSKLEIIPIEGMGGIDMSIVGSLPNLQVLKLKNYACYGDSWETSEGEFPELKFLLIDGSYLQYWITKSDHFPRPECLALQRFQYLRERDSDT
ncbi:hypothetical protein ACS0TY_030252 [Phlomoides rotata]